MGLLKVIDLGCNAGYREVFERQEELHARRVAGEIPDTLLLLEHRPVYTLGRSAEAGHILYSQEALAEAGIECVETTRGGDVTYHGPGQLVGYPIMHLGKLGLRVVEFIGALEEILIRAVAGYGIAGGRDERNRGVWLENNKLAALGIRVARQVTMHGFALNVNTRLGDYGGIVACGLQSAGVTSMAALLGRELPMVEVKQSVVDAFAGVLGCSIDEVCHE